MSVVIVDRVPYCTVRRLQAFNKGQRLLQPVLQLVFIANQAVTNVCFSTSVRRHRLERLSLVPCLYRRNVDTKQQITDRKRGRDRDTDREKERERENDMEERTLGREKGSN